jgi:hypothetical protein
MSFDMKISNQSRLIEDDLKASMYHKLHEASKKSRWMRLSGPAVGAVSGFATITARIALIGENLIKGLANLYLSPTSHKNYLRGLEQIFILLPAHLIRLPFSCASALIGLFTKTLFMAAMPQTYTYERWQAHEAHESKKARFKMTLDLAVSG